jgi:hypothetical protein
MTTRILAGALLCLAGLVLALAQVPEAHSVDDLPAATRSVLVAAEATPCSPTTPAGQPGIPVESNGVVITLGTGELSSGSNSLEAAVETADQDPVEGAMVFVTIQMPAMNHGISGYPAEELGEGRYRARNLSMGMAGEWIVTVEVIRQGRAPASASFEVSVSEP